MSVALDIWVSMYHFVVSFVVQVFQFSKFWFSALLGLGGTVPQELDLIWLWFLVHTCKMMMSSAIFFHFSKILIFLVFQTSSVNGKGKFCRVPNFVTCVWFFFCIFIKSFQTFHVYNFMLLANWQDSYIHTCQIWFQIFHFPIASYQFPSMSSKLVDMCRTRDVDSKDDNLWNSCQNLF